MLRSQRFGLVLSPTEKAAVTKLAEAEGGLSQAAMIRRLIRLAAMRRGLWRRAVRKPPCPPEDGGSDDS